MDPQFEKLSVGTLLVGHAIKYAFDRRLSMFDFMRGEEPYKFRWTQQTRRIMAVRLGVSRRGRAALLLRRQFLALKQLVKRLIRRDTVPNSSRALSVP